MSRMKNAIRRTVGEQISYMARKYPDEIMVSYTELDYTRTWKEFDEECERIARGFVALGLKKGSHIAIWATNLPCWLLTFFGCAKMGGVCVSVNAGYKSYELDYLLRDSDVDCLVLIDGHKGTSYVDIVCELVPELKMSKTGGLRLQKYPRLKNIVYAGNEKCPKGMLAWDKLQKLGGPVATKEYITNSKSFDCYDTANIQYTSGTTGRPKGVMLSHYNILNNGLAVGDGLRLTSSDKLCIPVPFFHCFGLVLGVMGCITHGTPFVPIVKIEAKNILDAIESEGCTAVHGVPTTFIKLLAYPELVKYSFAKMRTGVVAGASCPENIMRDIAKKMNMSELVAAFGQTESSPAVTMTRWDEPDKGRRYTTVGRAMPGVECKIVDIYTGEMLAPGNVGEFCARGNNMQGYYDDEKSTAEVIDEDGWLHFGDLAVCDDDGYYRVVGRVRDVIIRGGENVYPKEVEEYLCGCSGVTDAQVVAMPSQKYGEEVCAVVICEEKSTLAEKDIIAFCGVLSEFKIPRYVMFAKEYPMTPNGKIKKTELREMVKKQKWKKVVVNLPSGRVRELYLCELE